MCRVQLYCFRSYRSGIMSCVGSCESSPFPIQLPQRSSVEKRKLSRRKFLHQQNANVMKCCRITNILMLSLRPTSLHKKIYILNNLTSLMKNSLMKKPIAVADLRGWGRRGRTLPLAAKISSFSREKLTKS